ncbi:6-phosphogluconate dehydrogenase [Pseudoroseomonas rhizosphaerae]|uniref:6-phosphogluconate dehydrogenase n=1 Tax=Teichococcus rhizosphaerae TaxID=1335062 RepID=A0A2C7ADM8_9PROT|nr:NAD(P)-dependent oxidoreductase [Pseudoroseomonas rhizosphaerae]PHK95184.1 6-phosphogluconate dehydrogenase [Pseudoroseomonas rhizosphaerae]
MTGTVGFIGLGTMGCDMARNLLKAGYRVRGHDLRADAARAMAAEGVVPAASVAEAAAGADIVVTMLPDTPHVQAVVLGEGGLLSSPPAGRLVVDMSTIAPTAVREMHARLKAAGIGFVDAPVSGGPQGARAGTLSIMAGGDAEDFARARPVLAAMGTTINHVGESGAGQTVKLCNQLICGINLQAVCEAIALGRAAGVDLAQMREVLLGGSAASWMLDRLGPAMIESQTAAGFRIDLMLKDLRLVRELADALSVPLPGTALVTTQYVEARAHGEGGNGNQALFKVYDRMTNQAAA